MRLLTSGLLRCSPATHHTLRAEEKPEAQQHVNWRLGNCRQVDAGEERRVIPLRIRSLQGVSSDSQRIACAQCHCRPRCRKRFKSSARFGASTARDHDAGEPRNECAFKRFHKCHGHLGRVATVSIPFAEGKTFFRVPSRQGQARMVARGEFLLVFLVPAGDERTLPCPRGKRHYLGVLVIRTFGGRRRPRAIACRHLRLGGATAHEKCSRGQSQEIRAIFFHNY